MKKKIIDLEEELDKQFPKGDKARGRALVLYAIAMLKIKEANEEIIKDVHKWFNEDSNSILVDELKKKYLGKE